MKSYTIFLDVQTPVHIGSGTQITKKEFTVNMKRIDVYDPFKLYSVLGERYEALFNNPWESLTDYLFKNRVKASHAVKYSVHSSDSSVRKTDSIAEFIKDPYGNPYIPGSSLKGAIRTALLSHIISQDKDDKYKSSHFFKAQDIEEDIFGKHTDSALRFLRISDSLPLSTNDLIICKKIDMMTDGTTRELNICREALRIGTTIKFKLTIEKPPYNIKNSQALQIDYIMSAIESFADQYKKVYSSKFSSNVVKDYGDNVIYLGGGVGFNSKTINHSLYKEKAIYKIAETLDRNFRRHNHYKKDISLGVSPRALKCTFVNGTHVEMGICRIRIKEDEAI